MSKANAGAALIQAGQIDEAIDLLEQAVKIEGTAAAHCNLAVAYRTKNLFLQALLQLQKATDLTIESGEIWNTYGMLLEDLGEFNTAAESYKAALKFLPDSQQVQLNYAYTLMRLERFDQAWPFWESGRIGGTWAPPPRIKIWNGEDIIGKRLLVILEGGYGDGIMFARWFPALYQLCELHFLVWDSLLPLFDDRDLHWVDRLIPQSASINPDDFDFCAPLMSLPRLVGMHEIADIPRQPKYIFEKPELREKWFEEFASDPQWETAGPSVGLCWHAEENSVSRKHRSLPVEHLSFLRDVRPDAHFFSLCPGVQAPDWVTDHTRAFLNWAETAAYVANLDLVITVDTAVAHLAGALGIPTWIMVPHRSDWKFFLNRNDSPWYPSARLFRQADLIDWQPVVKEVADALQAF